MIGRRRFLTITAAAIGASIAPEVRAEEWRGHALGAEAQIVLRGDRTAAKEALVEAKRVLASIEAEFSIYDRASAISRLNRAGRLADPSADFRHLLDVSRRLHEVSGGVFDPTIQTVWAKRGGTPDFRAVTWSAAAITLGERQQITFNGIAQGFAADRVSGVLARHGFGETLVSIGEMVGRGGPWTIGLSDPAHGHLGTRALQNGAIATSSPGATRTADGRPHILDPRVPESVPDHWSTVSVEAKDATFADATSTALCYMGADEIAPVFAALPQIRRVTLVDREGDLRTLTPETA